MIGKLLSATGEAVYTATETASLLVLRSKEIEEARKKLEATAAHYHSKCHITNGALTTTTTVAEKKKPAQEDMEQVLMLRIKNYSTDGSSTSEAEEERVTAYTIITT